MIYFIAAGRLAVAIKIGFTADPTPDARLEALQTGNHMELFVLAFGPGNISDDNCG